MGNIILGVDPGLANMGLAVIQKSMSGLMNQFVILHTETVITKPRQKNRLLFLSESIKRIHGNYNINHSYLERSLIGKSFKNSTDLAMAVGAIVLTIESLNLEYDIYLPDVIKKGITGYGRADKNQMESMVKHYIDFNNSKIKNLDKMTHHEIDAICIGIFGHNTKKRLNAY